MTASETGHEIPADELQEWANTLGFLRHADALQARAASFRRLHGNMLMYGEGQALGDEHAAMALRGAAMLVASLLARIASLEAERARTVKSLVERLRQQVADADADIADALADAETTGEFVDPDDWHVEVPVDWLRECIRALAPEKGGQADG